MHQRRFPSLVRFAIHALPFREMQLAVLAACALFLFAGDAAAQNPTADCRFENSRHCAAVP